MLISLFGNQQRVISLGNNDLSVTRSWPLITHHLRCFLTKPRQKQHKCSVMFRVSWGGLHGAWGQVPHPDWGTQPAQPCSPSPTYQHTRKDFLMARTWPSGWVKKEWQEERNLPSSTCFDISEEKLIVFSAMKGFFFSQCGMVSYGKRL